MMPAFLIQGMLLAGVPAPVRANKTAPDPDPDA